jgi:hypothetical protein
MALEIFLKILSKFRRGKKPLEDYQVEQLLSSFLERRKVLSNVLFRPLEKAAPNMKEADPLQTWQHSSEVAQGDFDHLKRDKKLKDGSINNTME